MEHNVVVTANCETCKNNVICKYKESMYSTVTQISNISSIVSIMTIEVGCDCFVEKKQVQ